MRELIVRAWCDRCEALGHPRTEAEHTYTIGIVKGETRPALRVVELCDECDSAEIDVMIKMVADHSIPLEAKAPAKLAGPYHNSDRVECLVCHVNISRGSVVGHIWSQHRAGEKRPPQPTKCPECHQPFGEGMGMHRNRIHGWSALDEAYLGLI
jgi:hypothetical protein